MDEKYHTMLCEVYVEKLFKLKKPTSEFDTGILEGNLKIYYDKLNYHLKNSKIYNTIHILEKIKDTWMIDLEIYLYSS